MSVVDSIMRGTGKFIIGMNELLKTPPQSYCVLNTTDSDTTLSADDGSLVTVIEMHGNLSMVDTERFNDIVKTLETTFSNPMEESGYALQCVINYDPERSGEAVDSTLDQAAVSAKRSGMDIEPVLKDWRDSLSNYCSEQRVWFAIWTYPNALSSAGKRKAQSKFLSSRSKGPYSPTGMNAAAVMTDLHDPHNGIVSGLTTALSGLEIVFDILTAHQVLRDIRTLLFPKQTSHLWEPVLPGDNIPLRMPEPLSGEGDYSHMQYPQIGEQLFPDLTEDKGTLELIDDRYHAPVSMTLPPQDVKPFNVLYRALLNKKNMPWRISFLIDGGGMNAMPLKPSLAAILHVASSDNKKINKAMEELADMKVDGVSMVRFRCSLDTWAPTEELAKNRRGELISAIQGWGGCDGSGLIGDPMLGVSATLPGFMKSSPATSAIAPLNEALTLMPIGRPASPWPQGGIPLRTPDGKLMPINLMSSLQNAWIDIGVAPMGYGKSVWLNTQNLMFVLQPFLDDLPYLSIVDIGPSSKGLITLLKNLLPKDMKHKVAYHRLRMEAAYAINSFDLPVLNTKPLPSHMSFLVNFVSLIATPVGEESAPEGISGIARAAINAAYDEFSPDRNPKVWKRGIDKEVDKYIDELGLHTENLTWYRVAEALFNVGEIHMATRAQRYAVPLLSDIASISRQDMVSGIYKGETVGKEKITDYFWRSCVDAISAYPIFSRPTAFDIGDAKVVALDLDEVAPRGGPEADRQSGLMYMLARHVVGGKFFRMPADVDSMPEVCRDYHRKEIEIIRSQPKRLSYDEFHRVSRNSSISGQIIGDIETAVRESRKWNLTIGLYSQSINDYPEILVDLASSIYVMGVGTKKEAVKIADLFGLSEASVDAMMRLRKPGRHGGTMFTYIKTSKGNLEQLLTNTLGPQVMWALSSTTEDVGVRDFLYNQIGVTETLVKLAKKYPGGVKEELERIIGEMVRKGEDEEMIPSTPAQFVAALGLA
jgi:intracellular multiplication protein IcmB